MRALNLRAVYSVCPCAPLYTWDTVHIIVLACFKSRNAACMAPSFDCMHFRGLQDSCLHVAQPVSKVSMSYGQGT